MDPYLSLAPTRITRGHYSSTGYIWSVSPAEPSAGQAVMKQFLSGTYIQCVLKGLRELTLRPQPGLRSSALLSTIALQTEVEETLKRIQSHKGVIGTMVVNAEGIPIRTTLDNSTTVQYAGLLHQLTIKAKSTIRDIDPQNDLTFLRIRSKKHEIMVAPDKEYLLIVIQNPCE
ncbi:Dynein light chain roadblock-type 2 [Heterocephalus glaber]|uniref:Dynein light chain roadblock-type 2 n=1 Tax=Heterocephalus glaber TaxID=10181 RepID=G5B1Y1_HETGA|nr:Dynein light chain roadblock-type 2 [Heterocephalus glaber]